MSTNSTIAVRLPNNVTLSVYCHWDGYLDGVGSVLKEHYPLLSDVMSLVSNGDISNLDKNTECPDGHSFENPVEGCTVFYGRDREEDNETMNVYTSIKAYEEDNTQEFNYLFVDEEWLVSSDDENNYKRY